MNGSYISQHSGQGSLAKPALKVVQLVPKSLTGVLTTLANGSQVYRYTIFDKEPASGRCIMLDQNTTLGDNPGAVFIAFDEVIPMGNGLLGDAFTLQPQNVLDVRPGQFNTISVYVLSITSGFPSGVNFGRLIYGDGYYLNQVGASLTTPQYSNPGIQSNVLGSDWNGTTGSVWSAVGGGSGIFTYSFPLWAYCVGAFSAVGYQVRVKNIGSDILHVSQNSSLTNGSLQLSINQTFPISPGEEEVITNVPKPLLTTNLLTVYSPDANAGIAFNVIQYGV